MKARKGLVCLSLLAVAAGACSREAPSFESLSNLAQALSDAGVSCDRVDEGPEAELVAAVGTCEGSGVTLYLFDRSADLEDWKKVGTRIQPAAIGPDWAASGERSQVELISDELDAEIVSNP